MQTKARVTAVNGQFATVEAQRTAACDGCHKAEDGGCSVCSLMGSDRKMSVRALNTAGASVGDTVLIESNTSRMLWYAVLVFLFPILLCIAGWFVTAAITEILLWQVVGAATAFVLAFLIVFLYSRHLQNKKCDVEITEILGKNESNG